MHRAGCGVLMCLITNKGNSFAQNMALCVMCRCLWIVHSKATDSYSLLITGSVRLFRLVEDGGVHTGSRSVRIVHSYMCDSCGAPTIISSLLFCHFFLVQGRPLLREGFLYFKVIFLFFFRFGKRRADGHRGGRYCGCDERASPWGFSGAYALYCDRAFLIVHIFYLSFFFVCFLSKRWEYF